VGAVGRSGRASQDSQPIFKWCPNLFGWCGTLARRGRYVMLRIALFFNISATEVLVSFRSIDGAQCPGSDIKHNNWYTEFHSLIVKFDTTRRYTALYNVHDTRTRNRRLKKRKLVPWTGTKIQHVLFRYQKLIPEKFGTKMHTMQTRQKPVPVFWYGFLASIPAKCAMGIIVLWFPDDTIRTSSWCLLLRLTRSKSSSSSSNINNVLFVWAWLCITLEFCNRRCCHAVDLLVTRVSFGEQLDRSTSLLVHVLASSSATLERGRQLPQLRAVMDKNCEIMLHRPDN